MLHCDFQVLELNLFAASRETFLVHLPGEIFSTVDADLNVKGKPRLNAGVHESENRMDWFSLNYLTSMGLAKFRVRIWNLVDGLALVDGLDIPVVLC